MKVCQINTVTYGSTGKIMLSISDVLNSNGYESKTFSMKWRKNCKPCDRHIYFGSFFENYVSIKLATFTGLNGCFAIGSTLSLIKKLKEFAPDVIHLHNLHNSYVNLSMLFKYIKKNNIPVVWTLHDCWAFTGHCASFTIAGCDKWKTGCHNCEQCREYPASMIDTSKKMYALKKKWFTGVRNMTIVTPSKWLAGLVKQSYLKDYDVMVINNGINQDIFKPRKSDFREKYSISNEQHLVLGVSMSWGYGKGLDVFSELYKQLPKDKYKIVLVGVGESVKNQIPEGIITIQNTKDQKELAQIYSSADVFVNPTRQDNFPTVNIEALACSTPVVAFDIDGSTEMIDENSGRAVKCNDVDGMLSQIKKVCEDKIIDRNDCLKKASCYIDKEKFSEYVVLYRRIYDTVTNG